MLQPNLQQYVDIITKESLTEFFIKFILLFATFIIFKIIVFYALANLNNFLNPNKKKNKKRVKQFWELTPFELRKLSKEVDKIPKDEGPKLFPPKIRSLETHKLCTNATLKFKAAMQNKELKRIDIVYLRAYLSSICIQYPHREFKNDAHYIYTVLKYAKDIKTKHIEHFLKYIDYIKNSKVEEVSVNTIIAE